MYIQTKLKIKSFKIFKTNWTS